MPKFDTKKQPLMHTRSKRLSAREERAARVKVTAPKRVRFAPPDQVKAEEPTTTTKLALELARDALPPLDQVKAEEPTTTTKRALELARDALAQQIQRSEVFWDEQEVFLQDLIDTAFPWSKREALMERRAHLHAQRSDFMNNLEEQHKRASIECIKHDFGKFKALVPFVQDKPFALRALLEFIKRLENKPPVHFVIATCEDALSEMLIFNDDDTLLRVLDVLGKCMRQWDICPGLLFPESYFANEFPTLDFSQCELKLNFRLCVEEINSSFPFSPNSKAC